MNSTFKEQIEQWEQKHTPEDKMAGQTRKEVTSTITNNEKKLNTIITTESKHKLLDNFDKLQANDVITIQPIEIGTDKYGKHELLFFIKPEILNTGKETLDRVLDLLDTIFEEYNVNVNGIMMVGGKKLNGTIDRHYGFINKLSKQASRLLNNEDKKNIKNILTEKGVEITNEHLQNIIGGHEFEKKYGTDELNKVTQKSIRIDSGFYVQPLEYRGKKMILVNGFHPEQINHYTNSKGVICMVLHSDTEVKDLRDKMIGETDASQAKDGSIRNILYKKAQELGLKDIGRANNGFHLSAGLIEAHQELSNFLQFDNKYTDHSGQWGPQLSKKTLLQKQLQEKGVRYKLNFLIYRHPEIIKLTEGKSKEDTINIIYNYDWK